MTFGIYHSCSVHEHKYACINFGHYRMIIPTVTTVHNRGSSYNDSLNIGIYIIMRLPNKGCLPCRLYYYGLFQHDFIMSTVVNTPSVAYLSVVAPGVALIPFVCCSHSMYANLQAASRQT